MLLLKNDSVAPFEFDMTKVARSVLNYYTTCLFGQSNSGKEKEGKERKRENNLPLYT
jgi:hypothetical protein